MQVDYGPDAEEQLRALGHPIADFLEWELRDLFLTRQFPDDFRPLLIRHVPPWWWVRLNSAYAAVVRSLGVDELIAKGGGPQRLLVGLIVASEEDLRAVEARLIAAGLAEDPGGEE